MENQSDFYYELVKKENILQILLCNYYSEEITPRTREILIVWMIETCNSLRFSSKTKYLSILYVDLYLSKSKNSPPKSELQLIAVTCVGLAYKFLEGKSLPDTTKNYICANAYQIDIFKTMEINILNKLEWKLSFHTSDEILYYLKHTYLQECELDDTKMEEILDYITSCSKLAEFGPVIIAIITFQKCLEFQYNKKMDIIFKQIVEDMRNIFWRLSENNNFSYCLEKAVDFSKNLFESDALIDENRSDNSTLSSENKSFSIE